MKNRGLGPHSRRHRLGWLDGRTYEAKLYRRFRAALIEHVGGSPTIPQQAIIERAAWVNVRLAMMDAKVCTADLTEHDSHCYLAWANTLRRLLAALGLDPADKPSDPAPAIMRALRETEAA